MQNNILIIWASCKSAKSRHSHESGSPEPINNTGCCFASEDTCFRRNDKTYEYTSFARGPCVSLKNNGWRDYVNITGKDQSFADPGFLVLRISKAVKSNSGHKNLINSLTTGERYFPLLTIMPYRETPDDASISLKSL